MATNRTYGGVSADTRQRGRREQLVSAVLDVVGREGVSGVTVDGVCAAAGLTKRYFYESFANLDAALVAVLDRAYLDLRDRMATSVGEFDTPAERTRRVVELLIDTLGADPGLTRLYVEAPGHAALRRRRETAIAEFTDFFRSDALGIKPSAGSPARQLLAVRLVVAGTTDLVTGWLSGVITAERDWVVDTIVTAGLAAMRPSKANR